MELGLDAVESSHVRRAMRRAVNVGCEMWGRWSDAPSRRRLTELTAFGAWLVDDEPPAVGSELVVSFCLPTSDAEIALFAEVARVAEGGAALVFTGVSQDERALLVRSLVGVPPPLRPRARA